MTNKAKKLRDEASQIIEDFGILAALSQYGRVTLTGSLALDLMAWNDVDLIVGLDDGIDPATAIAGLAYDFIQIPEAEVVRFERNFHKKRPELPQGDYLQLKLAVGDYKLPWKFDIWFLSDEEISSNRKYMEKLKKALTPEKRELILELKEAVMLPSGRTPSLSGHWIYDAVLFQNMTGKQAILDYLSEKLPKTP